MGSMDGEKVDALGKHLESMTEVERYHLSVDLGPVPLRRPVELWPEELRKERGL